MKPKTFLSALSAVLLFGNVSCASFAVEEEAPIDTENLKSVHELELEQPISRVQNGKFVFVKPSDGNWVLCTIFLETEDEPRPMHINENDLIKGNNNSSIYTFMMPKFSPDGSKIAFSRNNTFDGTIYFMDQDGQNLKEIAEGSYPCFTPDGQRIVARDKFCQIFTCDLNGGDKRILVPTNFTGFPLDISWINFTPDGNRIYFIQKYIFGKVLKIADAVTGEIILTFNGVERASFSPDGKYIVCVNFFNRAMHIMDVESGSIFENLPTGMFNDLIWSPDGRNIFYSKFGGYCGLYDISFVYGRPVLETIMKRRISGAQNFAWQSLPI